MMLEEGLQRGTVHEEEVMAVVMLVVVGKYCKLPLGVQASFTVNIPSTVSFL